MKLLDYLTSSFTQHTGIALPTGHTATVQIAALILGGSGEDATAGQIQDWVATVDTKLGTEHTRTWLQSNPQATFQDLMRFLMRQKLAVNMPGFETCRDEEVDRMIALTDIPST